MVHFKFTAVLPLDPTEYFLERDSDAFRALLAKSLRLGSLDVVDGRRAACAPAPAAAPDGAPSTSGRGAAVVEAYTFVTRPDPLAFVAPQHRAKLGALLPGGGGGGSGSSAFSSPSKHHPHPHAPPPPSGGLAYTDVITYDPALLPRGGPYTLPVVSVPPVLAGAASVTSRLTIAPGPAPGTTAQTLEGDVVFRVPLGIGRLIEAGVLDNLRRVYGALPAVGAAWAEFRAEALALPRGGELLLSGRPLTAGVAWTGEAMAATLAVAGTPRTSGEGVRGGGGGGGGGGAPCEEVGGDVFYDAVDDEAVLLPPPEEEEGGGEAGGGACPAAAAAAAPGPAPWPRALLLRGRRPGRAASPPPRARRTLSRSVSPPRPLPTAAVVAAAAAAVRGGDAAAAADENVAPLGVGPTAAAAAAASATCPAPASSTAAHPAPALWFAAGPASPAAAAAAGDGAAAAAAWRAFWFARGGAGPAGVAAAPGLAAARALSGMLSLLDRGGNGGGSSALSAALCCGPPGGALLPGGGGAAGAAPGPSPLQAAPAPTGHVRSDSAWDAPVLATLAKATPGGGGEVTPQGNTPPPRAVGGGGGGALPPPLPWWARLLGRRPASPSPFGRAPRHRAGWHCWAGRPEVVV